MQRIRSCRPAPCTGFTIIELMIALVILGVVMALAMPAFTGSLRKGRRADALSALTAVQQAQERWRSLHPAYAANSDLTAAPPTGLGLASTTPTGAYHIAITSLTPATDAAVGYIVSASAVSTGPQAADTPCANMAVKVYKGNIQYGGSSGDIDWTLANPDPNRCWNR